MVSPKGSTAPCGLRAGTLSRWSKRSARGTIPSMRRFLWLLVDIGTEVGCVLILLMLFATMVFH